MSRGEPDWLRTSVGTSDADSITAWSREMSAVRPAPVSTSGRRPA